MNLFPGIGRIWNWENLFPGIKDQREGPFGLELGLANEHLGEAHLTVYVGSCTFLIGLWAWPFPF